MKDIIKKEEPQSLKSYIVSFIFSSLCSLALPVGLSFYFAPEKSLDYFHNTVQDKIDSVYSFKFEPIYEFGVDMLSEVPLMLKTEYDVLMIVTENVPPALETTASHLLWLDYRITLTLIAAIAIAGYFFPFQECKEWLINVIWGSVCIVSGFLPLDSGMEVLSDKDAGVYRMAVTLCAVIATLVANYLVVVVSWWAIDRSLSLLWRTIVRKLRRGKKEVEIKKGNNTEESSQQGVEETKRVEEEETTFRRDADEKVVTLEEEYKTSKKEGGEFFVPADTLTVQE